MQSLPYLWQGIELEEIFVDVAGRTELNGLLVCSPYLICGRV